MTASTSEPGSPPDAEKIDRLLRLVARMDRCIKAGGPSNYTQFLDPYDVSLVTEARQAESRRKESNE